MACDLNLCNCNALWHYPGYLEGILLLIDNCNGAAGAVVFGVQRLTPTYNMSFYKSLRKPT